MEKLINKKFEINVSNGKNVEAKVIGSFIDKNTTFLLVEDKFQTVHTVTPDKIRKIIKSKK